MKVDSRSLLSFLDSPVIVGDPEGRGVWANPAFVAAFRARDGRVTGEPLGSFFDGGGREAVLRAVAEVCQSGATLRFRLRQDATGWAALASPITAEGAQVGVLILLTQEAASEERLLAFHREIQEPLDEIEQCLSHMIDQTGGRRAERYRVMLEDGVRALSRVRKWSDALRGLVTGDPEMAAARDSFDPLQVARDAAASLERELQGNGIELELLLPAALPRAQGDGGRIGVALVRLLRDRLPVLPRGAGLTLSARAVRGSVLLSLVEPPGVGPADDGIVREVVEACGGTLRTTNDPTVGRMTAIQLPAAAGEPASA